MTERADARTPFEEIAIIVAGVEDPGIFTGMCAARGCESEATCFLVTRRFARSWTGRYDLCRAHADELIREVPAVKDYRD